MKRTALLKLFLGENFLKIMILKRVINVIITREGKHVWYSYSPSYSGPDNSFLGSFIHSFLHFHVSRRDFKAAGYHNHDNFSWMIIIIIIIIIKLIEITLSAGRHYLDVLSLTMFLTAENIVLLFWELLAYAYQIEILETLAFWMLTPNVETALPLDALRRQMASTVIPIYSVDVRSQLIWLTNILYF